MIDAVYVFMGWYGSPSCDLIKGLFYILMGSRPFNDVMTGGQVDSSTRHLPTCGMHGVDFYRFTGCKMADYYISIKPDHLTISQNKPIDIISRSKVVNGCRVDSSERFTVHLTVHPS